MSPHPHLTEFHDDLTCYKNVRLFCIVRGSEGMWQEEKNHRNGNLDDLLVLVKIGGRLYRYHSPEPLNVRMSQLEIAAVIRRKLMSSLRFQISMALGMGVK
jgi:hypothetical protein